MTIQTTYTQGLGTPFAGMPADIQTSHVEYLTANAAIPFGSVVAQGSTDGRAILAVASSVLIGVAVAMNKGGDGVNASAYAQHETMGVMGFGRIFGTVVGAAGINTAAYAIPSVGATQGQFTATANALGSVGTFAATIGSDGGIVPVDIKLQTGTPTYPA